MTDDSSAGQGADGLDDDVTELFEHAPCGYVSTLPDGTIVRVNETLLSWTGYTREEILSKRFVDLLTVPGRIYHDTHFAPLLAMQGAAREIALDLVRHGRPPLSTIASATVRRDPSGRIVLHRTTLFDATQRRSYERQLLRARHAAEQAATARDAMLSMLSHDMRSPLNTILLAVQLAEGTTDPDELARYHRMIQTASQTTLELVNAILEHSKLESGTAAWVEAPVDLRALAEELGAIFAVMAETKGLRFEANIDRRLPAHVLSDRFKLGQILTNLTSNAIKFTHTGEVRLDIRVLERSDDATRTEFVVSDTGIGISAEHVSTIFDAYDQGSVQTTARYGGTGLGLAICRRLLALADGTIEVATAPGEGSRFSFVLSLPVAAEPPPYRPGEHASV